MSLPSDYVNYIKLCYTDNYGVQRTILPSNVTHANKGVAQDEEYKYLYDQDGNIIYAEESETIQRFQTANNLVSTQETLDYYNGYYYDADFSYFGSRYGSTPEFQNTNGSFVLDLNAGQIYFCLLYTSPSPRDRG